MYQHKGVLVSEIRVKMTVRLYVVCAVMSVVCKAVWATSFAQDTSFNLDATNGICNKSSGGRISLGFTDMSRTSVFNRPTPEMVNVTSMGNLPNVNGSCTISFKLVATSKCDQICVSTNRLRITNDVVSVMFTPSLSMMQGMNCTTTSNLQMTLTQTQAYTTSVRGGGARDYDLEFVVSPYCRGNDPDLVIKSNEDTYMNPPDNKEYLIHGIVTGVMLALGWLVIFLIFKCYYKHNAFGGKRFYMEPVEHDIESPEQIQMTQMPQQSSSKGAAATNA